MQIYATLKNVGFKLILHKIRNLWYTHVFKYIPCLHVKMNNKDRWCIYWPDIVNGIQSLETIGFALWHMNWLTVLSKRHNKFVILG